ncbi:hypothetical protein F4810DRAFT_320103 [Camillea tinctor]|nr:hypothetical protein F4810DRAFT_320103 [Camillea tinctor]
MVAAYNARARNQGLSPAEMHATQGDLLSPSPPPIPGLFDLAAVGAGFHHFADPGLAARRLAERLKPGGVLMVVDFLLEDGQGHGHGHGRGQGLGHNHGGAHTVMHHGFTEAGMRDMFAAAGAGKDFRLEIVGRGWLGGREEGWVECKEGEEGEEEEKEKEGGDGKRGFKTTLFMARGTKV